MMVTFHSRSTVGLRRIERRNEMKGFIVVHTIKGEVRTQYWSSISPK